MAEKLHGGFALEAETRANLVHQGMLVGTPTTGSTQATGAGASDFNVDITPGILAVNGKVKEFAAQADFDLASAGSAIITNGQSIVVSIVAYQNVVSGAIGLRTFRGAAATTGSEEPISDADITAGFGSNTVWYRLANVTVNRTGDTTVTQSHDNTARPSGIYATRART